MIPKTNFFEQIEDYCIEQLEDDSRLEFEAELMKNPKLRTELDFWMDIKNALMEKEVLTLRNKLKNEIPHIRSANSGNELFESLNNFSDIQELTEILSSEELINYYDSLPKVHVYHHESRSIENIHQFYKEQEVSEVQNIEEDIESIELEDFDGLEEAILEKDILHFRQTLKQVAKSVEPQFTIEEIDDYINGELTASELLDFENDISQNYSLKDEVELHRNIEKSIKEDDVMYLRSQISNILRTETSWNVSEKSIEDFIDGVLEGELLEEFELELNDNTDLIAEVKLRNQINESLKEQDIFNLRKELIAVRESATVKKINMIIPDSKSEKLKFWRSSVAVLIVLIGLAGILGKSLVSSDNTYDRYFNVPEWSPERSVSSEITMMQKANIAYLKADYSGVVEILGQLPSTGNENPVFDFYKAASLQGLEKYNSAIVEYSKVINHGDNLFVEEAEWYRSLCYLKLKNYEKSRTELLAVIERKGHFENDAKAIIRRLKYSFK
jgi:hypothetical protein